MDGCKINQKTRFLDRAETPFGEALRRLVVGLRAGAATPDLVAACKSSLDALPVTTLTDAAAALDVEVAALEAEGPGRIWRIAVVSSVRDLLADLAAAGRCAALLPPGADDALLDLERSWLALVAEADQDADDPTTRAAWSTLLAVADAPAHGLTGVMVKLRVLLRFLSDTAAADPESPEHRLLVSTRDAVERLVDVVASAEIAAANRTDALFAEAGAVLVPISPPAEIVAIGSKAAGVSASAARRVYEAMVGAVQRARSSL